ncbi:MAG: hypothetical protein OXC80_01870 [Gammaproteobacteria bacterium]|nr:hypothetical protein [Gammaproteobacteria bacterium]
MDRRVANKLVWVLLIRRLFCSIMVTSTWLQLGFCVFAVLASSIAMSQSESLDHVIKDETSDVDRLRLLLTSLIEEEETTNMILHISDYKVMYRGFLRIAAMRPDAEEIKALDKRFADGITHREWREFLLYFGGTDTTASEPLLQNDHIEEVVAYGFSFHGIPIDPEEMSVSDIRRMRMARKEANKLYRDGEYEKAYPILLELARRGFRDAQSRLAYILFNGAGEVRKSNLRALGWLGAASAHPTEPRFKVLFKKYMRQVPDYAIPRVERIVAGYRDEYSHSEHWSCSTEHPYAMHHGSSIVKRVHCRYRLEAIVDACRAMGGGRCWADKVNEDLTFEPGGFDDQFSLEERLRSESQAVYQSTGAY